MDLSEVSVRFNSPATAFVGSYSIKDAELAEGQRGYFLHRDYFAKPPVVDAVFGERPDLYRPDLGPQFQIILSSHRVGQ